MRARLAPLLLASLALAAARPAHGQGFDDPYGYVPPSQRASALDVFDVEWQKALTEREPLAYAPRELAGPSVDATTGDVFVGTRDGRFRAFTEDGRLLWEEQLGGPITSPPAIARDVVLVGASDGKLHAFDRAGGGERWSAYVGAEVLDAPALLEGAAFFGTDHDSVHAVELEGGASRWVYRRDPASELSIRGGSAVGLGGGRVYAGFTDGTVVALDPKAGRLLWEVRVSEAGRKFRDSDAAPIYRDGLVFVTSYSDGVVALEASTGKEKWKAKAPGATSLTLAGEHLLASGQGFVKALRPSDGGEVWRVATGKASAARPRVVKGLVAAATSEGLLFLDEKTGQPYRRFEPGSGFSAAPAVSGRALYALSNLGYLYRLRVVVGEKR